MNRSETDEMLIEAKRSVLIKNYVNSKFRKSGKWLIYKDCPFCQSKDHFRIDDNTNIFCTFSGCNNKNVGSIIDYFSIVDNESIGNSIKKVIELSGLSRIKPIQKKTRKEIKKMIIIQRKNKKRRILNDFNKEAKKVKYNVLFDKIVKLERELNNILLESKNENLIIKNLYEMIDRETSGLIEYNDENYLKLISFNTIINIQLNLNQKNNYEINLRNQINKNF